MILSFILQSRSSARFTLKNTIIKNKSLGKNFFLSEIKEILLKINMENIEHFCFYKKLNIFSTTFSYIMKE